MKNFVFVLMILLIGSVSYGQASIDSARDGGAYKIRMSKSNINESYEIDPNAYRTVIETAKITKIDLTTSDKFLFIYWEEVRESEMDLQDIYNALVLLNTRVKMSDVQRIKF